MIERGLFILWEKARKKEKEIINDIKENFTIDEMFSINIENKFDEIIEDFYQHQIPPGEVKSQKCGTGEFLVVVVTDQNAIYETRKTLRAEKKVAIHFFDAKKRYRVMVADGDPFCIAIHGTNNDDEFEHDYRYLKDLKEKAND